MRTQQKKLEKELTRLWTGELAAVVAFWFCFFMNKDRLVDDKMMVIILYPLFILVLFLFKVLVTG